ncbi:MAG: hypothetical protein A2Z42_04760 [Candidatus Woykebacteria bacterium RBG_19FT_COMBO_43_10]|uniref:Excinuclease ABC subunit C n=1 Tax=Candidatus Woykebacteria bacterium RBG_19FT_COMBO_43_10 TaxID=1802598 RepID=A0A1G1WKR4_9BACT|nr:MAG: hypothetical protein A2Z42_04760 [Candidatus Woykebacteria bacterium RBG_19FT_COMBO_43_10]
MELKKLPENSGVYIFKDKKNVPIYIGKSANIKKRVNYHFNQKFDGPKESILINKVKKIEAIRVDSEIEALILEANLIKKYKPLYNTQLKDDKDYLYIKVTKDAFPKVLMARKKGLLGAKEYFGPFPSTSKVKTTLKTLRKIIPYSTCKPNQRRPCLYYHLGLCPGVCAGLIDEERYRKNIDKLVYFLKGNRSLVLRSLERELKKSVSALMFEEAQDITNKIKAIEYITKPTTSLYYLDENIERSRNKELLDLANLLGLAKKPLRIECYDISNIFGKDATGSMVVFSDGYADLSEYRRFKIKTVKGINDTAMISEVLKRRFNNDWVKPDLIVIDGGKPQLNAALLVVKELGLRIPVISLAKRLEEIYFTNKRDPIRLPSDNDALRLVQRMRDEAHRFAINYHRKLRAKQFLEAKLVR